MTNSRKALIAGLATEVLRTSGVLRLRVFGNSMRPAFRPGDILFVRRDTPLNIVQGDVVLYGREGRLFVHRVISEDWGTGAQVMTTRGDALAFSDPPLSGDTVLGRVVRIVRRNRKIDLESRWRTLLRPVLSRAGPVLGTCFRLSVEAAAFRRWLTNTAS